MDCCGRRGRQHHAEQWVSHAMQEQQALPPELRNKVGRPKRARLATATSAAEGVASEAGAAGDGGVQALLGGTGSGALLVQRRKVRS